MLKNIFFWRYNAGPTMSAEMDLEFSGMESLGCLRSSWGGGCSRGGEDH